MFASADVLLRLHEFASGEAEGASDLELLRPGQVVLGLLNPLGNPQAVRSLAERGVTAFALELMPRISRTQSMDALSSMATVAGYKAVLLGAEALNKLFPMMITAAGTITPARVLVIGAGVAGLHAIATARRLGAVVQAWDVRPAVKEQVESLGARFLEFDLDTTQAEGTGGYARTMDKEFYDRQREQMADVLRQSDVVITTAAVPGSKAPALISEQMVLAMKPGSVIVDLAAEGGGNCEVTQPGKRVAVGGVTVIGPLNLASTVPYDASQMLARSFVAFLQELTKGGQLNLEAEDPILAETRITHRGKVVNATLRQLLELPAATPGPTQ